MKAKGEIFDLEKASVEYIWIKYRELLLKNTVGVFSWEEFCQHPIQKGKWKERRFCFLGKMSRRSLEKTMKEEK